MRRKFMLLCLGLLIPGMAWAETWRWIAYGDTRTNDAAHRSVLHAMRAYTPDYKFIINVGDVVEDGTRQDLWDIWQKACTDELGGTGQGETPPRYLAVPGNHDHLDVPAGMALWNARLSGQTRLGNQGRFFTFDYQNARFIGLDSEHASDPAQEMMLQRALDTNTRDWLFIIWHKPIFDFDSKQYEAELHTRWGVPFYEHGGDLLFVGHAHYYVRSQPLQLNGQKNPPVDAARGVRQIVTGNGGAPLVPVQPNRDGNGYMVAYAYDVTQTAYFGYTELAVDGKRLVLKHIRTDGAVMDTEVIEAHAKPAPLENPADQTAKAVDHPEEKKLYFYLSPQDSGRIDAAFFNAAGERVGKETQTIVPGQPVIWETRWVAAGIYFYRMSTPGGKTYAGKVFVKRK